MSADERTFQDVRSESNSGLVGIIRERIERAGRITFAEFMELALYHPEYGYYLAAETRPGRAGDFLTAPEAHPIFGRTIARQIIEMWERLGRPDPFTLREYGAGSGTLALDILSSLREGQLAGTDLLDALCYEPVEINPVRHNELAERLAAAGFVDRLAQPQRGTRIVGCVLANEFLDALPVHRVDQRADRLREIYVVWRDGWFADESGPPSTEALAERFRGEGITLADGQRAEVALGIDGWAGEVATGLERGYVLVIDYGYPANELYGSRFPRGTLKSYARHEVHEDPYRAVGVQDLTAHVDFTAVAEAATTRGLLALGLTTQAAFLTSAGVGDLLVGMQQQEWMTAETYLTARAAVMHLIDPGGMGRFRVLVLGRGVAPEPPLSGMRPPT